MSEYQKYPLVMNHPHRQPAVVSQDVFDKQTGKVTSAVAGRAEKFPQVHVQNEDQELYYASLGYVPNGVADPEAYRRQSSNAGKPQAPEFQEFPKYLYQAHENGDIKVEVDAEEVMVRCVLVSDEDKQKNLKGDWFGTPGQAAEFSMLQAAESADALPSSTDSTVEPTQARRSRKTAEVA